MKKQIISILLTLCSAIAISAQETSVKEPTTYDKTTSAYKSVWENFIPNQSTIQYAGSIGVMNFGIGWHYYRNHWETEILGGWVPKYDSTEAKPTFTLKQRYIPWRLEMSQRWDIEPLTTGMFFNTIFGENFWKNEPERYGQSYYGFSSKVRINIFLGQRLRYKIPSKNRKFFKSISAYYEFSTCDLYVVSAFVNKNIKVTDILSLAFGLRLEIF